MRTWATVASVGNPPSISRAGAAVCSTPSSHLRQAYLGLTVTSPLNCAGTMSSRSLLSAPMQCSWRWQHGQVLSSISTISSTRGKWAGNEPRLLRRRSARADRSAGVIGFAASQALLDVLETEQHLVFGQALRPSAKPMSLQFLDDLTQPLVLHPLGEQHGLQGAGIIGKCVARHPQIRSYSRAIWDDGVGSDSIRHRDCVSPPASAASSRGPHARAASPVLPAAQTTAPQTIASRHPRSSANGRYRPRAAWRTCIGPCHPRTPV